MEETKSRLPLHSQTQTAKRETPVLTANGLTGREKKSKSFFGGLKKHTIFALPNKKRNALLKSFLKINLVV